jgi:hypothetical protein
MLNHLGKVIRNEKGIIKFIPFDLQLMQDDLRQYADQEIIVKIQIKKYDRKRSISYNDFYHGVFLKFLSDELKRLGNENYDIKKLHNIFGNEFLKETDFIVLEDGEFIETEFVKSTATLSHLEFDQYIQNIRQWIEDKFSNLKMPYPDPELKKRWRKEKK